MQVEGFDILHEEGPCLVVRKPGGLLTQAAYGVDSLEVRIKSYLKERDEKPGEVYLGLAHRLDRPASGLLVMGLHRRAAKRLGQQFERRMVHKLYWAVVEGHVEPDQGSWVDWIRKVPDVAAAEITAYDDEVPGSREAVLHYRTLARARGCTWLEITLETGRYHQIRLQAGSRGYPILGDSQYGSTVPFGPATELERDRWIALHARELSFHHPMTKLPLTVVAPLYAPWGELGLPLIAEKAPGAAATS